MVKWEKGDGAQIAHTKGSTKALGCADPECMAAAGSPHSLLCGRSFVSGMFFPLTPREIREIGEPQEVGTRISCPGRVYVRSDPLSILGGLWFRPDGMAAGASKRHPVVMLRAVKS